MEPEVEVMVQEKVRAAVCEAQTNLLGAFEQLVSSKLDSMQNKISENQQKLSDSQMAKMQTNILMHEGYTFKRKSCEDQYKFNVKVLGKFQDADAALERSGDSASLAAREKNSEDDYRYFKAYVRMNIIILRKSYSRHSKKVDCL